MIWNHCTPEQAVETASAARAKFLFPVHHQTFRLSEEPMHEPIERLEAALASEPKQLALSRVGETFVSPSSWDPHCGSWPFGLALLTSVQR
jgi:L-ascorbate metabolism protein UlaG (beta-lactamase superfamily)